MSDRKIDDERSEYPDLTEISEKDPHKKDEERRRKEKRHSEEIMAEMIKKMSKEELKEFLERSQIKGLIGEKPEYGQA